MNWQESDERAIKWEASSGTFWVLASTASQTDPSSSPAVSAFRMTDASFEEVQTWVREVQLNQVSIGIEALTGQGLGVIWLVQSQRD